MRKHRVFVILSMVFAAIALFMVESTAIAGASGLDNVGDFQFSHASMAPTAMPAAASAAANDVGSHVVLTARQAIDRWALESAGTSLKVSQQGAVLKAAGFSHKNPFLPGYKDRPAW